MLNRSWISYAAFLGDLPLLDTAAPSALMRRDPGGLDYLSVSDDFCEQVHQDLHICVSLQKVVVICAFNV